MLLKAIQVPVVRLSGIQVFRILAFFWFFNSVFQFRGLVFWVAYRTMFVLCQGVYSNQFRCVSLVYHFLKGLQTLSYSVERLAGNSWSLWVPIRRAGWLGLPGVSRAYGLPYESAWRTAFCWNRKPWWVVAWRNHTVERVLSVVYGNTCTNLFTIVWTAGTRVLHWNA